jgi:hypothetical protein
MSDYDMSIHSNPDARAWATFFMETWEKIGKPQPDEEWIIGWFANAMMAMYDHTRPQEKAAEIASLTAENERLRHGLATVLGTATHGQHMGWEERIKIGRAALPLDAPSTPATGDKAMTDTPVSAEAPAPDLCKWPRCAHTAEIASLKAEVERKDAGAIARDRTISDLTMIVTRLLKHAPVEKVYEVSEYLHRSGLASPLRDAAINQEPRT